MVSGEMVARHRLRDFRAAPLPCIVLFLAAIGAQAQTRYCLPHVASGEFDGGGFRTTFILFNNTDTDVTAALKLTSDTGAPLTLTIGSLGTGSDFSIFLPGGASRILQTDGLGPLVTGAATVSSPGNIGVSAVFTNYGPDGNFLTEAGVGSSEPLADFVLPVDSTGLFNTGLALFNPGNGPATITLLLRDTAGGVAGQTTLSLSDRQHIARFVSGEGQLFPSVRNFQGTLRVQSNVPVAGLGLRQNETPLSYTSLPVVSASGGSLTQNLAQVVNGSFEDGSYRTSFLLFNLASGETTVSLSLTRDNGSAFPVHIPGLGTRSTFVLSLKPGASAFLQTDGSGGVTQGAATITSSAPIGAAAIFSVFSAQGEFRTEAGVGNSPALMSLTLPVDVTEDFNTGMAFFNPASTAATLSLKLLDANGALRGEPATMPLAAKSHAARFITEIFPGTAAFRGSVAIASTASVAALTLRQKSVPLSYTTLPVVAGFASGKTYQPTLLTYTKAGVLATADVTVDATIPLGWRLSGQIYGAGTAREIVAQGSDGRIYPAAIDTEAGRYLITLGGGTYMLRALYDAAGVTGGGKVSLVYNDPSPVEVSGDTNRDLSLPSAGLTPVSGSVSGLAAVPETTDAAVVFTSADLSVEGTFGLAAGGSYQGSLPPGDYRASITVPLVRFTNFQNQSLALYNVGTAGIGGAGTVVNLTVPAMSKVSGIVRASWLGAFAFGILASATDRTVPPAGGLSLIAPPAVNVAAADPTGAYQMVLVRGRSYSLSLSVPLLEGSKRLGTVVYPWSGDTVNLDGDTAYSATLPDLPGKVKIAGRVTDPGGQPLEGISVLAYTKAVSGASNLAFAASAVTDSRGNYVLTVVSGTEYELQFIPAIPTP